jgi:hypothetical protein
MTEEFSASSPTELISFLIETTSTDTRELS